MSPVDSPVSAPGNFGFQGSETSRPEAVIYTHGDRVIGEDNRIVDAGGNVIRLDGVNQDSSSPSIISYQSTKALGPAAGSFTLNVKVPRAWEDEWEEVMDDDWVDIVLNRHGRRWHILRGMVDENRRSDTVGGTGATSRVWTVTGKDYGRVWEKTQVWFSKYCRQNVSGHFSAKVFTVKRADNQVSGVPVVNKLVINSPEAAVQGYLFGFLEELDNIGRENWQPPALVPEIKDNSFVSSLILDTSNFLNVPERRAIDPNFVMVNGNLWDLAKDWSDPMFTELYVDVVGKNWPNLNQDEEHDVDDSQMVVVFRDKPFPIVDSTWDGLTGKDSIWFDLPLFVIPRQAVDKWNVGRGGMERYNAFFVTNPLYQETQGVAIIDQAAPLWDLEDVRRHGLRRFDIQSKYKPEKANMLNLTEKQRGVIRDWYCLNPFYLNGTIELKRSFPEIRIGTRVRFPGATSAKDETYYVESVSHSWTFQAGLRTTLGVTRGFRGTDDDYLEVLKDISGRYEKAACAVAGK